MEKSEQIEVIKEEIKIIESGFAGIISGSLVDMRNYPNFKPSDKEGLIKEEHIDNFLIPLKKELNDLT